MMNYGSESLQGNPSHMRRRRKPCTVLLKLDEFLPPSPSVDGSLFQNPYFFDDGFLFLTLILSS